MIKRAFLFLLVGSGFAALGAQGIPAERGGNLLPGVVPSGIPTITNIPVPGTNTLGEGLPVRGGLPVRAGRGSRRCEASARPRRRRARLAAPPTWPLLSASASDGSRDGKRSVMLWRGFVP